MMMSEQCQNGGGAWALLCLLECSLERDFPSRTDPSYVDAFCTLWSVRQAKQDSSLTPYPILIVEFQDTEEYTE